MLSDVNIVAVIAAALLNFIIGMIWYSQPVFGKTWMELAHVNPEECKKNLSKAIPGCLVVSFLMALALAQFVNLSNAVTAMDGAKVGFWAWLGFGATIPFSGYLWEKKPLHLYLICTGCYLVSLLAMGVLLALWR